MPISVLRNPTVNANVLDFGADNTGNNDSTAAFTAAMNLIKNVGKGNLLIPTGNYLIPDGWVVSNASNFTIKADRGAVLWIGPNTVGNLGRSCHNVFTITDCTDFTLDGINVDARRDTIAANQYLTANAASGQANITVQDGTKYVVGEGVWLMGGQTANGGTEKNFDDSVMIISAIIGNVLTMNRNLNHSYTGTGASGGAYLTRYQCGGVVAYTVAGRSLGNEDAQNGIHLITCQRFIVRGCTAVNTWESPIKCGTGFQSTTPTDGCSRGIITGNMSKHGYDQGVSVWNSQYINVSNNWAEDAGWAGVCFTHCNDCTATGNVCINNSYNPAFDLNEGTGLAIEGGVRVVVTGNVCTGNNNNGMRIGISPLYGGGSMHTTVAASHSGGDTTLVVASASNIVAGASFTYVDHTNPMIRETIYVQSIASTTVTLARALRNNYVAGSDIYARYGEDCLITGNVASQSALSAGIKCDQQINLRIFSNDASENGLLNGAFVDTQGTYGIQVENHCEGAVIQANTCRGNAQEGIFIDNLSTGSVVLGNDVANNGIKGTNVKHGIKCLGLTEGAIIANKSVNNTGDGIALEIGTLSTTDVRVSDNICYYNNSSGIRLDNGGKNVVCTGNKIAYNNDTGIKVLGYKDSLFAHNQCYNQNGQEGIRFDDSGTNYCTDNKVYDNMLYDDRGGSAAQSYGFRELNNSARTLIRGNRTFGNTSAGISKSSSSTPCNITAPGMPASTVAYTNTTTYDCTVIITGGTVTVIAVGGVTTGLTSGTVRVPVGQTIAITYTVAPSWMWYAE